jgi:hypothetical protein
MYHVKYRDFFGKLVVLEGRSEFEDAESEAEDCVHAHHSEVEILVDLNTADANLEEAAAFSRRQSLLGVTPYGCCDDGPTPAEPAAALR